MSYYGYLLYNVRPASLEEFGHHADIHLSSHTVSDGLFNFFSSLKSLSSQIKPEACPLMKEMACPLEHQCFFWLVLTGDIPPSGHGNQPLASDVL